MKKVFKEAVFVLILSLSTTSVVYAQSYNLIDIGALGFWPSPGSTSSLARDINNAGQVTGSSSTSFGNGYNHAYTYNAGVLTDLGTLGGNRSSGYAINNNGQVTGTSWVGDSGTPTHAFVTNNGVMVNLGTLGGENSFGLDINDVGQVAGSSNRADGSVHAFVTINGVMTDLGIQSNYSEANGINNSGQVTGFYSSISGAPQAFVAENGVVRDIGTLGGQYSLANAINDLGLVVGVSQASDGSDRNFISSNGVMTDIGYLGYTADINNKGQIVGQFDPGPDLSGREGAFLYDEGNVFDLCLLTDCTQSGWLKLELAEAINDNGDIVGYGINGDGRRHGFIAVSTVPVPAAFWLFGSGLVCMIGFSRRKE